MLNTQGWYISPLQVGCSWEHSVSHSLDRISGIFREFVTWTTAKCDPPSPNSSSLTWSHARLDMMSKDPDGPNVWKARLTTVERVEEKKERNVDDYALVAPLVGQEEETSPASVSHIIIPAASGGLTRRCQLRPRQIFRSWLITRQAAFLERLSRAPKVLSTSPNRADLYISQHGSAWRI